MKRLILTAALAVAGCSTSPKPSPEPLVIVKEVKVPVAVTCVPDELKGPPAYPDTDEALLRAAGPEDRYQLVVAGRDLRVARLGEVEPVVSGCR